jgi:hypothetical protein
MIPSTAGGLFGEFETTNAIAQGGSGQPVADAVDDADAFSTVLPDRAYAETVVDGASNVADALLGPHDTVFGIAILARTARASQARRSILCIGAIYSLARSRMIASLIWVPAWGASSI